MQKIYMEISGLKDIPFNFLIGGDGSVYEGRGNLVQGELVRSDTINEFEQSGLVIAFIGNFLLIEPSATIMSTFAEFLEKIESWENVEELILLARTANYVYNDDNLAKVLMGFPNFYARKNNSII